MHQSGKITETNYDTLFQKISVTGNSYEIHIEVKILDDTSSRLTTVNDAKLVSENNYYSVFNDEILNTFESNNGEFALKKSDYIVVTVINTNKTFGTQMRGFLFNLLGKDTEIIVAKSSAEIQ